MAASLQAVTLFSVAEDLSKLRLQVNVDEADVGSVKVGQKASFTVSAYPSRKFPATITRVAYGSTTTENVVTYITYLEVDNSDLTLRPGMTATATITATERKDVLLVPNTALRYSPSSTAGKRGQASSPKQQRCGQPDAAHAQRKRQPQECRRGRRQRQQAGLGVARRRWLRGDSGTNRYQRWPHDRGDQRRADGRHARHHRPAQRRSWHHEYKHCGRSAD